MTAGSNLRKRLDQIARSVPALHRLQTGADLDYTPFGLVDSGEIRCGVCYSRKPYRDA